MVLQIFLRRKKMELSDKIKTAAAVVAINEYHNAEIVNEAAGLQKEAAAYGVYLTDEEAIIKIAGVKDLWAKPAVRSTALGLLGGGAGYGGAAALGEEDQLKRILWGAGGAGVGVAAGLSPQIRRSVKDLIQKIKDKKAAKAAAQSGLLF